MAALLSSLLLLVSCNKEKEQKPEAPETPVTFTVALNSVEAEYVEVVVRHDGAKDNTWYGFVTTDLTSTEEDLIQAQLSQVTPASLHVGQVQTVAIRNLEEVSNYRYIAFGTDKDGKRYGVPGSLVFNTSPDYQVSFALELGEVTSHAASVSVSHEGNEVLTYRGVLTTDVKSDITEVVAKDYASIVVDGALAEGVELLSGTATTVELGELTHETAYRYVIYGLYDDGSALVSYGSPAEVSFTTPIDLSIVAFSATLSGMTLSTVDMTVSYDAKQEDLNWYGFVTKDLQTPSATLIATAVQGLSQEDLNTGAKTVTIEGLELETDYRYIVTGVNADGAWGVPADLKFSTLTSAYINTVFTVTASEVTAKGATLTITHTGEADFQYYGFFTEDLESELSQVEVPADADSHLVSGLEKVITVEDLAPLTTYRYVVVGRVFGAEYGTRGEVVFTTSDPSVPAAYEEFIGKWIFGDAMLTISEQESGSTYTVSGLPGLNKFNSTEPKPVTALYQDGKFVLKEQIVGEWNNTNYGTCYDIVCGLFEAESTSGTVMHFVNYPRYADTPSIIFTIYKDVTYGFGIMYGSSENGVLDQIGVRWVIASGQYKGQGNVYSDIPIPSTIEKAPEASDAYNAWLGTWYIPTTVYQYDAQDNYIGDEVQTLPITIAEKVPNESYLISGIGPENESYDVLATFSGGELVLNGQTVYTWNHSSVGEINERFVGIYMEGEDSYYTWSPDLVVCTGKTNSAGTSATFTPGQASNGTNFTGFGFKQCYTQNGQNVAYGYGGEYSLPVTLTRTAPSSSLSVFRKATGKNVLSKGLRAEEPRSEAMKSLKK